MDVYFWCLFLLQGNAGWWHLIYVHESYVNYMTHFPTSPYSQRPDGFPSCIVSGKVLTICSSWHFRDSASHTTTTRSSLRHQVHQSCGCTDAWAGILWKLTDGVQIRKNLFSHYLQNIWHPAVKCWARFRCSSAMCWWVSPGWLGCDFRKVTTDKTPLSSTGQGSRMTRKTGPKNTGTKLYV